MHSFFSSEQTEKEVKSSMPEYATMYWRLLAAQSDAIDGLKEITDKLIKAHLQAEEMYISSSEHEIVAETPDEARTNEFSREN